ncbi:MAG: hypothetical protein JEZ06_04575 [Anaerolineaceae bacterium]|nr:hypothetical protein [Anaerolineaceae bacterium]
MTLEKAKLKWKIWVPPMWGTIDCQFNPQSFTISKTNTYSQEQLPNYNAPTPIFSGGKPATYSLTLHFDTFSHPDRKDVREITNKLLRLTLRGAGYSMFKVPYAKPPSVSFVWGKISLFSAVVTSVKLTYTMFAQDGTPTRAKADIDFLQSEFMDDFLPAMNPTSRSDPRKTRIVNSSQRLDQIAHEEYGDSRLWRLLAEANDLDDPFGLQDGQLLVIPQDMK